MDHWYNNDMDIPPNELKVKDYQLAETVSHAHIDHEPKFNPWWKALILVGTFLSVAAIALAVTLFTVDMTSNSDLDVVKCDPNQFPGATGTKSDGTNQWSTFTPTKSSYRNVNGLVAWTIDFTFVPKTTANFDSTYILMNFKLPVKLAQPVGIDPFPVISPATSSGLAVFNTNTTWRSFVEPNAALDDSSVTVRFARWDSSFRSSSNSSYLYAPTILTQDTTGTGSIILYYMGGNKSL